MCAQCERKKLKRRKLKAEGQVQAFWNSMAMLQAMMISIKLEISVIPSLSPSLCPTSQYSPTIEFLSQIAVATAMVRGP